MFYTTRRQKEALQQLAEDFDGTTESTYYPQIDASVQGIEKASSFRIHRHDDAEKKG